MEELETGKLAETVEAGLRDGRSLESLRRAMGESGYSEDDVRQVISSVDRKKTIRRPQRAENKDYRLFIATAIVIIVVFGLFTISSPVKDIEEVPQTSLNNQEENEVRTCYVINESIKDVMIEAGAKCDKWFLIREI